MAHGQHYLSETNPNDVTGGGGCVCSPEHQADCRGPYVVFPGNDMENPRSPHVVIGQVCVDKCFALLAGETDEVVESTGVELDDVPDI